MRTKLMRITIAFSVMFYSFNAVGQIKISSAGDLLIPTNKDVQFDGQWGIEYYTNGLNIYKPSPSTNTGNYKLFIQDATGNIGIGTGDPQYGKIDINSSGLSGGVAIFDRDNSMQASFRFAKASDNYGYLIRGNVWSNGLLIKDNGYIGIGMVPTYKLDVNGQVRATVFSTSSDKKLKKNINDIGAKVNRISMLHGVEYNLQ